MSPSNQDKAAISELLFVPLITIAIIIISVISITTTLNKRVSAGLANPENNSGGRVRYISTAILSQNAIELGLEYIGTVVYIDFNKINIINNVNFTLFDPNESFEGTTITIFNSPTSALGCKLSFSWAGGTHSSIVGTPALSITLGIGQGVTLITALRRGSHLVTQWGGITFREPDLLPEPLLPRDWMVFQYHDPQKSMCSRFNGVPYIFKNGTNASIVDTNVNSSCGSSTITNSGVGFNNQFNPSFGLKTCTSFVCNCNKNVADPKPYPPLSSIYCNT